MIAIEPHPPIAELAERFLTAVRRHRAAEARELLQAHPEIAGYDLACACATGDERVAEPWLASLTKSRARGSPGKWPPLVYLCRSTLHGGDAAKGEAAVRIARRLLDQGADANARVAPDEGGDASLSALYFASHNDHVALVRELLARGADPNDGESIYHAAEENHRDVLELLLAHGGDLSRRDPKWTNTPLYFLCGHRDGEPRTARARLGIRWLLEHGADSNVKCQDVEETPLHLIAASGGGAEVAAMLLEFGADPKLTRKDGRDAWRLATRSGNAGVQELLRARGATSTTTPVEEFIGAAARGDVAAARAIQADYSGVFDALDSHERSAIALAADLGRLEAVRALVALGFDLTREHPWTGTGLHWAAWRGNVPIARELLEAGAPLNLRDRVYGSSPIAWAAHGSSNCRSADDDYIAVIGLLLEAGSEFESAINHWGAEPVEFAPPAVAAFLRERGFVRRTPPTETAHP